MANDLASSNASDCPLTGQALTYRADRAPHLVVDDATEQVPPFAAKGGDFRCHFILGHVRLPLLPGAAGRGLLGFARGIMPLDCR